ncbi:MAG: GreA/GreB family elongation factor [Patescibacteria group bacterium]
MDVNKIYYLTKDGLVNLRNNLQQAKDLRKAKLGKEAPSAFYSEELNSEFVSFRDEMDALDIKIDEMEHILKNYEIIKPPIASEQDKISLGAKVKIEIDGDTDDFTIVGTWEANPALGLISDESPVGRALLGKKVGEIATLNSPIKIAYKIKKITY